MSVQGTFKDGKLILVIDADDATVANAPMAKGKPDKPSTNKLVASTAGFTTFQCGKHPLRVSLNVITAAHA